MSFLKSDYITLLDSTVSGSPYRITSGMNGAGGRTVLQAASLSIAAAAATTVNHRFIRVPTNAIIHTVSLVTDLQGGTATTITGNIGLFYSDNANDGTPTLKVGGTTAVSASFFAYQKAMSTYVGVQAVGQQAFTDVTFANATGNSATDGFYVPSAATQPLWMALTSGGLQATYVAGTGQINDAWNSSWSGTGAVSSTSNDFYNLTADPGAFLDICFTPTTTTSMDAAHVMTMRCLYTLPGG